ncbi:hypothetical protein GGI43DRAFT_122428 [Trichoderma evansii]
MAAAVAAPAAEAAPAPNARPTRPDEKVFKEELAKAEKEHKAAMDKFNAIKAKIDVALPNKNKDQPSPTQKRRQELIAQANEIRQKQAGGKNARTSKLDQIKRFDEQLRSRIAEQKTAKAKVPFKSVEDVDRQIESLEKLARTLASLTMLRSRLTTSRPRSRRSRTPWRTPSRRPCLSSTTRSRLSSTPSRPSRTRLIRTCLPCVTSVPSCRPSSRRSLPPSASSRTTTTAPRRLTRPLSARLVRSSKSAAAPSVRSTSMSARRPRLSVSSPRPASPPTWTRSAAPTACSSSSTLPSRPRRPLCWPTLA